MTDYLYRSKPTLVEAIQWNGRNWEEVFAFTGPKGASTIDKTDPDGDGHPLQILAGKDGAQEWVPVPPGHWLVRPVGDDSDLWPVEDTWFRQKYEEAGPK